MNKLFNIEREAIATVAKLSPEEMNVLERIRDKTDSEEQEVIYKILSVLKRERWADWAMDGHSVCQWLEDNKEDLFFDIGNELLESSFSEEQLEDVVWLTICWLKDSISAGVAKNLGTSNFQKTPASLYKEIFPLVKTALMKKANDDRTWQERTVLESYLGGLEQQLMECEVQEILLK